MILFLLCELLIRSYSGLCNNVAQPYFGASHTPLARMLKSVYADGVNKPRESVAGKALPPVRGLSLTLFSPSGRSHHSVTTVFAHWMQIVASDMINVVQHQAIIGGQCPFFQKFTYIQVK